MSAQVPTDAPVELCRLAMSLGHHLEHRPFALRWHLPKKTRNNADSYNLVVSTPDGWDLGAYMSSGTVMLVGISHSPIAAGGVDDAARTVLSVLREAFPDLFS